MSLMILLQGINIKFPVDTQLYEIAIHQLIISLHIYHAHSCICIILGFPYMPLNLPTQDEWLHMIDVLRLNLGTQAMAQAPTKWQRILIWYIMEKFSSNGILINHVNPFFCCFRELHFWSVDMNTRLSLSQTTFARDSRIA